MNKTRKLVNMMSDKSQVSGDITDKSISFLS